MFNSQELKNSTRAYIVPKPRAVTGSPVQNACRLIKEYEAQQEFIAKEEEYIRRNLAGQKTKQAKSRRKMLDKLQNLLGIPLDIAQEIEADVPGLEV